jgi:hypothetical protein
LEQYLWFYIFQYGLQLHLRDRRVEQAFRPVFQEVELGHQVFAAALASVILPAFYSNCEDFPGRSLEFACAANDFEFGGSLSRPSHFDSC